MHRQIETNEAIRNSIIGGMMFLAVTAVAVVWYMTAHLAAALIVAGCMTLLIVLVALLTVQNKRLTRSYMEDISNLIDSITGLEETVELPLADETMLSKLQFQLVKLTELLKTNHAQVSKEKEDIKSLISDISHQIKTPVSSIKMYTDLLLEPDTSEEEKQGYLQIIGNSAEKLSFLTDALIKMSRLESGIILLKQEKKTLTAAVLGAILQAYPLAKEKEIEISFKEPTEDIVVAYDEKWTTEAIFNIIENGIKYSDAGQRIEISMERYELFCRINITDSGPGIPQGEESKVFKRFYRGAHASRTEGVGIGLYLTKEIIMNQQGYVLIRPEEKGSTFSVFLPLEDR